MIYTCKRCGNDNLLLDEMYNSGRNMWGCKVCYRKYQAEWRAKNPKKVLEYREKYPHESLEKRRARALLKSYGLTLEEYNKLLEWQLNGCAICRLPCNSDDQLCVDHNHKTGKVRALLCRKCNLLVGNCREDEDIIWNLLDYIKEHNNIKNENSFEVIHAKDDY